VFWLPEDDTSVIILAPTPEVLAPSPQPHLIDLGTVERDEQGAHAILHLATGDHIQLLATNGPPLAAVIPLDSDGFARLESVYRLLAAIHGRRVPTDRRMTKQQRVRARRMLRAFDAIRDGATQQDIALVLFRMGPLTRHEWQASSVRHAIKTLLRDARKMVTGGYLRVLHARK